MVCVGPSDRPWDLLDDTDVDGAVSMFYTLMDATMRDHVPVVTVKKRFPPWFTGDVRRAILTKQASLSA